MGYTLTPEREKELIEKVARFIVDNEFEGFAKVLFKDLVTTCNSLAQLGFVFVYPFAIVFGGDVGQDLANLLGLDYEKNAKLILQRVNELKK